MYRFALSRQNDPIGPVVCFPANETALSKFLDVSTCRLIMAGGMRRKLSRGAFLVKFGDSPSCGLVDMVKRFDHAGVEHVVPTGPIEAFNKGGVIMRFRVRYRRSRALFRIGSRRGDTG